MPKSVCHLLVAVLLPRTPTSLLGRLPPIGEGVACVSVFLMCFLGRPPLFLVSPSASYIRALSLYKILTYCLGCLGAHLLLFHLEALPFSTFVTNFFPLLLQILFIPLAGHDVNHLVIEVVHLHLVKSFIMTLETTTAEAVDNEVGVAVVAFSEVEIGAEVCSGTAVQVALVGIIEEEAGIAVVLVHVEGGAEVACSLVVKMVLRTSSSRCLEFLIMFSVTKSRSCK